MFNFRKDLQFTIGKLTQDAYSHVARKNPLQKQDTKALSAWIFEERNDLYVMRMLGHHRTETNKAFAQWINEEHQEDLDDIGDKLNKLLEKQAAIEVAYAAKYQEYRRAIKAIREREDRLSDIREKKRSLQARINNLTKSSPKSPRIKEFTKELEALERDTLSIEIEMGDFKRFALREAFYLRFNAMKEMADKLAIIAGFGKYIVDLLDIEPTPKGKDAKRRPYESGPLAAQILEDAFRAIDSWKPAEGEQRPTLADQGQFLGSSNESVYGDEPTASTSMSAATEDKGKQKQEDQGLVTHDTGETSEKKAPQLPPRKPAPPPAGYSASSVALTTGDAKVPGEVQASLDDLDLYGPPPAYYPSQDTSEPLISYETAPPSTTPTPQPSASQPVVYSEAQHETQHAAQHAAQHEIPKTPPHLLAPIHQEKTQEEEDPEDQEQVVPQAPGAPLLQKLTSQASFQQSPVMYTQSPLPVHQQLSSQSIFVPFQGGNYSPHPQYSQQGTLWSQPYDGQFYQSDYSLLYNQVSQFHVPVLPYAQFQQQFFQPQGYSHYHQHQPVDAGGFRIPPSHAATDPGHHPTAEEEKQALAEHYRHS